MSARVAVITVSDRAAAGERDDATGPALAGAVRSAGLAADDPRVVAAYEDLADAFEAYDDALNEAYGEMTPLIVVDDADLDDSGDEEYDDDEDDEGYSGLDDEEYDDEDKAGDEQTPGRR